MGAAVDSVQGGNMAECMPAQLLNKLYLHIL